jgi:hypothetical protein
MDVAVFQSKELSYYNANRMRGPKAVLVEFERDDRWFRERGGEPPSVC